MLQKIRDRLQAVVAWVILGLLAVGFAMWGPHGLVDLGGVGAGYAATVKSDLPWWKPAAKIRADEVKSVYQAQMARYQQMMRGQPVPDFLRTQLQESLIEDMVRSEV